MHSESFDFSNYLRKASAQLWFNLLTLHDMNWQDLKMPKEELKVYSPENGTRPRPSSPIISFWSLDMLEAILEIAFENCVWILPKF